MTGVVDERLSYLVSNEDTNLLGKEQSQDLAKSLMSEFSTGAERLNVFCRIRPIPEDCDKNQIQIESLKSIKITIPNELASHRNNVKSQALSHRYEFSKVYGPEATQSEIFKDTTYSMVSEVLNGKNCLFYAYGTTGAGKTHTIQGTEGEGEGVLPRAVKKIFEKIGDAHYLNDDLKPTHFSNLLRLNEAQIAKERQFYQSFLSETIGSVSNVTVNQNVSANTIDRAEDVLYAVYVSMVEIYNESINDLLEASYRRKASARQNLLIGEDKGVPFVKGLKEVRVHTADEALALLKLGRQNLQIAETKLNRCSSRSHSIFTIKLVHAYPDQRPIVSVLSICDLAGSERSGKMGECRGRLREAANINTSLLFLGRCVEIIRKNQRNPGKRPEVIPFRESNITRLFQPFFTGQGLVSLIVNISPSTTLLNETLRVLMFSALAREVKTEFKEPEPVRCHIPKTTKFQDFVRKSLGLHKKNAKTDDTWRTDSINSSSNSVVVFGAQTQSSNEAQKRLSDVTEANEELEEEDENAIRLEFYGDLVEKLRVKLLEEVDKNAKLEEKIRRDLVEIFAKKMDEMDQKHKEMLENERGRMAELSDWRVQNALELAQERKRRRTDHCNEDGSLTEQIKKEIEQNKELNEEISMLKYELQVLKETLNQTTLNENKLKKENTNFVFEISSLKQKIQNEEKIFHERNQDILVENLKKELDDKKDELKRTNEMLAEAANDFINKDYEIEDLRKTLKDLQKEKGSYSLALYTRSEELDVANTLISKLSVEKIELINKINEKKETGDDFHNNLEVNKNILAKLESKDQEVEKLRQELEKFKENEKHFKNSIESEKIEASKFKDETLHLKEVQSNLFKKLKQKDLEVQIVLEESKILKETEQSLIFSLQEKSQKEQQLLEEIKKKESFISNLEESSREFSNLRENDKSLIERLENQSMKENEYMTKINELEQSMENLYEELNKKNQDIYIETTNKEELEKKYNEVLKELENNGKLIEQLKDYELKNKEYINKFTVLQIENEKLRDKITEFETSYKRQTDEITELEVKNKQLSDEVTELEVKTKKLSYEITELHPDNKKKLDKIIELQSEIKNISDIKETLELKNQELLQDLKKSSETLELKKQELLQDFEKKNETLELKNQELLKDLKKKSEELEVESARVKNLVVDAEKMKDKIKNYTELNEKNDQHEKELESFKEFEKNVSVRLKRMNQLENDNELLLTNSVKFKEMSEEIAKLKDLNLKYKTQIEVSEFLKESKFEKSTQNGVCDDAVEKDGICNDIVTNSNNEGNSSKKEINSENNTTKEIINKLKKLNFDDLGAKSTKKEEVPARGVKTRSASERSSISTRSTRKASTRTSRSNSTSSEDLFAPPPARSTKKSTRKKRMPSFMQNSYAFISSSKTDKTEDEKVTKTDTKKNSATKADGKTEKKTRRKLYCATDNDEMHDASPRPSALTQDSPPQSSQSVILKNLKSLTKSKNRNKKNQN